MSKFSQAWKNAFAVDEAGAAEPTEAQGVVVDKICREVVRRHLATPTLLFLEMSRPLNYLGAQVLHYFQPIVSAIINTTEYEHFALFLEHRGSIEYLCRRIEQFESECERREGRARGVWRGTARTIDRVMRPEPGSGPAVP